MTTNLNSLSLTQLFGEGAYQDASILVIQKSSLLRLTANNNRAESLLTAILITSLQNFQGVITNENNQVLIDENYQPIEFDNSDSFQLLKMIEWQAFQFIRNQQKYINNQVVASIYAPN